MKQQLYQILHVMGVFMVFLAYGGLIVRSALGSDHKGIRRLGAITSGIGLVLMLVGGFGLLAVMDLGFPIWAIVKIIIWVILGAMIVAINRLPRLAQDLWWSTIVLGLIALLMVVLKPF